MAASSGYGQANPNDASTELTGIAFVVSQMIAEMSIMTLVQVKSVTGGGVAPAGTVSVQPLVSQIDGNGYGTPHGVVPNIPWSRVQGGKNAVICDPAIGDIGYVVSADRDISKVKNIAAAALPGSRRRNDICDGVYAGGLGFGVTPNQYLIFTSTGVRLIDVNGNSIALTNTGFTFTDGVNGNSIASSSSGMTLTFAGGNKIICASGFVNIEAPQLQVNGVPVTVP